MASLVIDNRAFHPDPMTIAWAIEEMPRYGSLRGDRLGTSAGPSPDVQPLRTHDGRLRDVVHGR